MSANEASTGATLANTFDSVQAVRSTTLAMNEAMARLKDAQDAFTKVFAIASSDVDTSGIQKVSSDLMAIQFEAEDIRSDLVNKSFDIETVFRGLLNNATV